MNLVPVNAALVTRATALTRRRPQSPSTAMRDRGRQDSEFTALLDSFADVVEAEFEEVRDEAHPRTPNKMAYLSVLFPEFLLKSRYVNYYL